MKFRVQVQATKLTKLANADAVEVKGKSLENPGEFTITVPLADARDYKVGDVVQVEVRARRENE